MRKITLSIFLLIIFFLLSEFPADAARGVSVINDLSHQSGKLGEYRALIIGINDYKDPNIPDLETAANDASAMAELLRERYGFKIKLLLDRKATKEAVYQALRSLASSTQPDDSVLIYYAGHGDLDRTFNDGWWIPADAKGGDPVTYLDNSQVQKAMRSMQARHVLLISDSCYSGTLFGEARAMPPVIDDKYYLNLYNEKSRWGMTSGNKTPVSDSGSEGHSVFAYQLLKELRKNDKPYISTQEIYTRIAPIVGNNSEQTPLCRPIRNTGDQGGEFVFVASNGFGSVVAAPVKTEDTGLQAERERLEQERKELEKIKAEATERQRIEEERQRIEAEKKQILAMGKRPAAAPGAGKKMTNSLGMEFVYISPGSFMMGSGISVEEAQKRYGKDKDYRYEQEHPQHRVTLTKGFYLQTTEVTQGQWQAVMGSNPSHFKNCGDNCPVEKVSWRDTQEFIKRLNRQEGGEKYRLPTEAEWEYACRAGSTTPFPFGDDDGRLGQYAWYDGSLSDGPHPVGQKKPNKWGLYDMLGNVWEFCQDWYGDYPSEPVTDPKGPSGDIYGRVDRGGSWYISPRYVRSAARNDHGPGHRGWSEGFRLLRTE